MCVCVSSLSDETDLKLFKTSRNEHETFFGDRQKMTDLYRCLARVKLLKRRNFKVKVKVVIEVSIRSVLRQNSHVEKMPFIFWAFSQNKGGNYETQRRVELQFEKTPPQLSIIWAPVFGY